MIKAYYALGAVDWAAVGNRIWNTVTSKTALLVYSVVILVLVIVLAVRLVVSETGRATALKEELSGKEEAARKEEAELAEKRLDKKLDNLAESIKTAQTPVYIPPDCARPAPLGTAEKTEDGEEAKGNGSRFYMLTEIDKEYENKPSPEYDGETGLQGVCEEFRNFAAGRLKLYYDIEDIRRFIGGLAVTKLIILQGMSGTGKTSLAYAFGEFLDNKTVIVPIQPMWKERTDLVGYYNEFTKRFNETTLLYKMYEANCNDEIYITVLDEMNIARVEYYFAEFLSLLEIPNPDGRNLDVVADKWEHDPKLLQKNGKLRLPTNMWFVGTANNDDSTFAISDKVYDRAMVLNLDKKAVPFEAKSCKGMKLSAVRRAVCAGAARIRDKRQEYKAVEVFGRIYDKDVSYHVRQPNNEADKKLRTGDSGLRRERAGGA